MIDALVCTPVRVRPVSAGRLAYGACMHLLYHPAVPYEVRLGEVGPDQQQLVFARDLLASALHGQSAGEGQVRVRLEFLSSARNAVLLLTVGDPAEPLEFALKPATVADFLRQTYDLVPAGEEHRHVDVDGALGEILGDVA